MTKLIHITDIHFELHSNINDSSVNSECLMESMIKHIKQFHSDADACIMTGDMVNNEAEELYSKVFDALKSLEIPILLAAGNHDNREILFKYSNMSNLTICKQHGKFIQYSYDIFNTRIITIDTNPERINDESQLGCLCLQRLEWLDDCLSTTSVPTVLLMHHSPIDTGIAFMDKYKFANKEELAKIISKHVHCKHIFFGHVHSCISGHFSGISCSTPGSCSSNISLQSKDSFIESTEDPSYGVILINDAFPAQSWSLTAHRIPFNIRSSKNHVPVVET